MTNTQIILKNIIEDEFSDNNEIYKSSEDYFEFFSARSVLKNYSISDEEIEYGLKGAGNDGGCDSIYIFCNGILVKEDFLEGASIAMDSKLEMIIIQSKTSMKFGEDAIMKWKTISSNLLDLNHNISDYSSRYNADVRDSFQLFREVYTSSLRKRIKLSFKYIYVTEGIEIHPNVKQQGEELKEIVLSFFPAAHIDIEYIGANDLLNIINTPTIQDYELALADTPISLGKNKDYVALVSLSEFFHFITNHSDTLNQSIFEANIRDYQGSVVVNKEIYDSLCNNRSDDFWWLNNGITILANNIVPVTNKSLVITDPEIVNGLQTSNEIFNYFSDNPDAISTDLRHVLVRIIVPTSETSRDEIIRATNNQTTIPKASLRASDAIHWQIEIFFKQKGLYYDRRKNHYKNLGKKSSEIISVSYLAQCLIAVLLGKPNYSRARPSTLLTNDEYYDPLYKGDIEISIYYFIVIWANQIKQYLKTCGLYDTTQQGDMLFYILYYSFAKENNTANISTNNIKSMNIDSLSEEKIITYTEHIFNLYQSQGGNSKAAKGSAIIELLKNEF